LGLYEFPDARKQISEAFRAFIIEKNYLSSDQVNFLRTIQSVFTEKHHIEYRDLLEPPFTYFGHIPIKDDELTQVLDLCEDLEREVFVASS
jgi:type I restriction enzyme R subunit